jgi:hypothetical protein
MFGIEVLMVYIEPIMQQMKFHSAIGHIFYNNGYSNVFQIKIMVILHVKDHLQHQR